MMDRVLSLMGFSGAGAVPSASQQYLNNVVASAFDDVAKVIKTQKPNVVDEALEDYYNKYNKSNAFDQVDGSNNGFGSRGANQDNIQKNVEASKSSLVAGNAASNSNDPLKNKALNKLSGLDEKTSQSFKMFNDIYFPNGGKNFLASN